MRSKNISVTWHIQTADDVQIWRCMQQSWTRTDTSGRSSGTSAFGGRYYANLEIRTYLRRQSFFLCARFVGAFITEREEYLSVGMHEQADLVESWTMTTLFGSQCIGYFWAFISFGISPLKFDYLLLGSDYVPLLWSILAIDWSILDMPLVATNTSTVVKGEAQFSCVPTCFLFSLFSFSEEDERRHHDGATA